MEMEKNHSFGNFLKILYQKGDYAVFVFFVISGVVFSNVYLTQRKNENFYNFFIKRFARLYPLHILTLFLPKQPVQNMLTLQNDLHLTLLILQAQLLN